MTIRCKRCFKVYDDLEYECPRCKKINDTDYSKRMNKEKKQLAELIKIKKRYQCTFCGTKKHMENGTCSFCGSDKIVPANEMIDSDRIDELVDAVYANNMSQIEVEQYLKEDVKTLEQWRAPYELKFGKRYVLQNFYIAYLIYSFIVLMWLLANVNGHITQFVLLVLFIAPVYFFIKPLQRFMHSESLNFFAESSSNDSKVTFSERPEAARYKYETYQVDTSDLTNIIITMSGNKIGKLRFISKSDLRKKQLDYEIETSDYDDQNQMKRFLILYCRTYKIMYHIQVEESEVITDLAIKKEQYFIRRDTVKVGMTEDELLTQSEYIKTLGEKVLLIGAVEKQNIMILKTLTFEEAELITSKDPLVMNGKISYDIKTLDITYQTIN